MVWKEGKSLESKDFVGSSNLIKLALKREKFTLPLWLIGIFSIVFLITAAYAEFTPRDMMEMIMMASPSPGMRMLMAPVYPYNVSHLGSFFLVRMSLILTVIVVIMNIQLIVRHTRNNEDTGCAEMLAAMEVGRYAIITAALIVAVISNFLLMLLITLAFVINGLSLTGSLAAGMSFAGIGLVFSGITAITAQLASRGREASSLAFIILAFLSIIHSMSNVFGKLNEGGLGFKSAWFTWLSPVGWVQQVHPFTKNSFWVMFLFILLFSLLIPLVFYLTNIRDIGSGILPAKKGPDKGGKWLLNPLGLAWKIQRKMILGWAIPVVIFGCIMGASSTEFGEFMEGMEGFEKMVVNSENFLYIFITLIASLLLIYATKGILRAYTEEQEGYAEGVLATAVSRGSWLAGHILLTVISSISMMLLFAIGVALSSGVFIDRLTEFLKAALFQSIGITVVIALTIGLYGLLPRISKGLSWLAVFVSIFFGPFFGPLLNLPEEIQKISPFTHIAPFPKDILWENLSILLLLSISLSVIGVIAFNKRDLRLK